MNTLRAIWYAQFISLRNATHHDARTRIAAGILLIFNIGVGYWSISQLSIHIQQWQARGTTNTNLWLLCIDVWIGMSFFSIIGMLSTLGRDETLLLFTLPISPATRFRALYSTFFVQNLWNWLLLEIGCVGYVLMTTLGAQGLLWLLLMQSGVAIAVACTLVLALLFIRYILVPKHARTRILTLALCVVLVLAPALNILPRLQGQPIAHLTPVPILSVFIGLLLMTLGPLAKPLGELYTQAFRGLQSGGNTRKAFTLPGVSFLQKTLARRNSLTMVLFMKALLTQSRNGFFWLRLVLSIVLIVLFPLMRTLLTRYGFSATLQVIGYASGVAVWHVLEVAPGAMSGEANRLTLYLIAPLKPKQIIRAKLLLFLLPILVEGLCAALFLSWQVTVSLEQLGFVLLAVLCIITASVTLPVLGSIWDEDLEATVEGSIQALLLEEAPISPKRMGLLNLSVLLFVGMLLILWKVQALFALVSLIAIVGFVFIGMWHFSNRSLKQMVVQK